MYCVAKTKAMISFAVTAKLICVFVFANADCWFSHVAAHNYLVPVCNFFNSLCNSNPYLIQFKNMKIKCIPDDYWFGLFSDAIQ